MRKFKSTIPVKGKPYFGSMSEDILRNCEVLIQSLIFAYKSAEDKNTVTLLQKCHKDIANALIDEEYEEAKPVENIFSKKKVKKKFLHLTRS